MGVILSNGVVTDMDGLLPMDEYIRKMERTEWRNLRPPVSPAAAPSGGRPTPLSRRTVGNRDGLRRRASN